MKRTIPFNRPPISDLGHELTMVKRAMEHSKLSGDGPFSKACEEWFEKQTQSKRCLMTPSCTHALEEAALLLDIKPGDEVIMPSYTFVSTANAFALRGAKIKFVDIRPDNLNINENLIEQAITDRTKAIVPVHYAGNACEMETIMNIAYSYNIAVVEDAAQGVMANYQGAALGSIGDLGTFSFHETKNFTSGGEGGLLLVNRSDLVGRSEIMREKGTNRSKFLRGDVDKYTWVDLGSSYLPGELTSAFLYGQIEAIEDIHQRRLEAWNYYHQELSSSSYFDGERRYLPSPESGHNAHLYFLMLESQSERDEFIQFMKDNHIGAPSHYVPLHSSPAGQKFGEMVTEDHWTTNLANRLVRLPLFYQISREEQNLVLEKVESFLSQRQGSIKIAA